MVDMPLSATQALSECGANSITIDGTGEEPGRIQEPSETAKQVRRYSRVENDWYVEPESATTRLLEVERPFIGTVLDPCCGQGNVVNAVWEWDPYSCHAIGTDVVQRGPADVVDCFSRSIPAHSPDSVISNPPYSRAQEVAEVALEHTRDRVCLFLRAQFLEGQKRSSWLNNSPLARVWFFPDRVACIPGHLLGKQQKRFNSAMAYAWFVWERGYRGDPKIGWLFPEGK